MERPVIIALDFPSSEETKNFLQHFKSEKLFLKVGMELFYREGPLIVRELKAMGHRIFLDLKLHDIPNTVYRAMGGIAEMGIDFVTVHASGGYDMMVAAAEGLKDGTKGGQERTKCIAVTQLTSTTEKQMQREQLVLSTLQQSVLHYTSLAKKSGLDGVVSSVFEAPSIREHFGNDLLVVTPGIRLLEEKRNDQKRVADPVTARKSGSSAIVVGRSIITKPDPYRAYLEMKGQWEGL